MGDLDVLFRIYQTAGRLDVATFVVTVEGLTRGGLPSSTRPDPARARAPGLPELDKIDRAVLGWRASHSSLLRAALAALVELEQLQRRVIPPDPKREPSRYALWVEDMSKQAELDHRAPPVRCSNCTRWVLRTPADKLRAGRCSACAAWRKRHGGEERPEAQWTKGAA